MLQPSELTGKSPIRFPLGLLLSKLYLSTLVDSASQYLEHARRYVYKDFFINVLALPPEITTPPPSEVTTVTSDSVISTTPFYLDHHDQ